MNTPFLALRNAAFAYPNHPDWELAGVDFELVEGERVGIIGDNGSGKTTLLHTLVGLRALASGQLLHRGKAVETKDSLRALRREVGIVFQHVEDQLFSPTVLDDVAFGPLNLGMTQQEAREHSESILDQLAMRHLAHRLTHTLSGGEKRLVALATILVMQPKGILLDEPTNDLDARGRRKLAAILQKSDIALVLVSHDAAFVKTQDMNRILTLADGRLNA